MNAPPVGGDGRRELIARALEVCGDRWTLLIVHAIATGTSRFGQLTRTLDISRTVLTRRLQRLLDDGILERHEYHPLNGWSEYRLTRRGLALYPAIAALIDFASLYPSASGPPEDQQPR